MTLTDLQKVIPHRWKVQTVNKTTLKGQCVAYIDARDVMKILDESVGAGNWQDKYEMVGDKFIAGIGIKCDNEWVWKWDTGTSGDIEHEKSEFSDAFKRAGVKWGIGRFLYDLDFKYVKMSSAERGYPVDDKGNRIWDLTEWFANNATTISTPTTSPKPATAPKDNKTMCPKCGGEMWDNRPKKASGEFSPASPDFKCKDKTCGGLIWPPKDKPMAADGSDYMESLVRQNVHDVEIN